MNRVLLVLSCNLHLAPFYIRYENLLKKAGIDYDLLLWNREGISETTFGRKIEYTVHDEPTKGSTLNKVIKFLGFSRFVKKSLKKKKYDKVVFVGTYAGVPALISKYLEREYKGRYWIDMRDITYETISFFYRLEAIAIKNSYKTVISSKGYLPFLPKHKYGLIHNIDPTMEEIAAKYKKTECDKIRISYIGNLGYWDSCREMIDILANDERFIMNFVGPYYERVQEYCESKGITNTTFHGRFKRDETVLFYNETDIIYNIYGNNTVNVRTALSNKLYYALRFKLPILVSKNTYMEKFAQKYNIGISFENSPIFADKLYSWFQGYEEDEHLFDAAWTDVLIEDKKAVDDFIKFIGG